MASKVSVNVLLLLLCAICHTVFAAAAFKDGLLANGNFELGPKKSDLKGTKVTRHNAIPKWEISGVVEYIKSGHTQGDMLLIVPEGEFAVRLGNEASITQRLRLKAGQFYSITFSAARTCAQEERLNVSVSPTSEPNDWGVLPMQTMYSSNGWDSYSCGFKAEAAVVDVTIHNPGVEEDQFCGPLIDSVALKRIQLPKRSNTNLLKNGNFEEGPYVLPNTSWGVIIPPHIEDAHSPLPGWIIESLKAVKYIDSEHFAVPEGKRAIEFVGGKESSLVQIVHTIPGKQYVLTFSVGDSNNACEGSLGVEAFAGKSTTRVAYKSSGKGGSVPGKLRFTAEKKRTVVRFLSTFYTMTSDHTGTLCGPVLDDVRLISVRFPRRV